eukprot:9490647-Pyramimonas_sp.AAC.1
MKGLGAALAKMAAKRHKQMRNNKKRTASSTATTRAKGPMKSIKGPMKSTKKPVKSDKSMKGSKTSFLLTRSSINMAEANIGVVKTSLYKRGYLGKRSESMRMMPQLFYENTPGLTPMLNAMGEFTKFFLDSCDPWQLFGNGNWRVVHQKE